MIWLLSRHLRRGSPSLWVVYLASGLTVLNNFDFGICCLVATIVGASCAIDRSLPLRSGILDQVVQAAVGLTGALLLVTGVTLLLAGEVPDLSILTYWSNVFGRQGFGLLPMPAWGLHWALYFTYVGALLAGSVRLIRDPTDRTLTPMLAFMGVFGLLTGQYFAGRSQGTQLIVLFPVWGFTLALLTLLVVRSLRGADLRIARRSVVPALAVLIGFGLMVATMARIPAPWHELDRISTDTTHPLDLISAQRFVEAHTNSGERVVILTTSVDHRVAERAGVANVSPWGSDALFSKQELDRMLGALDGEGGSKIFLDSEQLGPQGRDIIQVLKARGFTLTSTDHASGLGLWVRGA